MGENINICYVDDNPELQLSKFLKAKYLNKEFSDEVNTTYTEYRFKEDDDYKKLLKIEKIKYANIIIIDSKLFEESNSPNFRLTGEQFKIILRSMHPYVKTIVISQNEPDSSKIMISKYKSSSNQETSDEYYLRVLKPEVDKNIDLVLEEICLIQELKNDGGIDNILLDGITQSFRGNLEYSEFEKNELNNLISLFQEVKKKYEQK